MAGEHAVSCERVDAPLRHVAGVGFRDPGYRDPSAGDVQRSSPQLSLRDCAEREISVGRVESIDLGPPVRKHRAHEDCRSYGWPGNLRELRNAVERALILSPGPRIEPEDLGIPAAANEHIAGSDASIDIVLGADVSLEALEREHIARAPTLETAAKLLGIDSTTLQRKRKRYGLT